MSLLPPPTIPGPPATLPSLAEEAVQVRVMQELFKRTRESALVGFLPVGLIVWSHWDAQPYAQLLLWAGLACAVLVLRMALPHFYLRSTQARQATHPRLWYGLEWLGASALALVWAGSLTMVGSGQVDPLFYLRLIFIIALASFMLSALGIVLRLYAGFLALLVLGTLYQLHTSYPVFMRELPIVDLALAVYALMLMVRSRGEQRRTREWVRARLTQRLLLDQLNQTIQQELQVHEALRRKTLELETSNRKLGELATRDGLTGALRRGHVEGELRRMVKAQQRRPTDFSVQLIDIDFFKRVNDVHGHATGDEVLRRITAQARQEVRASDLFGRWGGEEFIVLLPDTRLEQAMEAAERLRLFIQRLTFRGEDGQEFGVTVSIGVAQLEPDESADDLIQRVDKALYAAKHHGRNRVVAHEPGQSELAGLA